MSEGTRPLCHSHMFRFSLYFSLFASSLSIFCFIRGANMISAVVNNMQKEIYSPWSRWRCMITLRATRVRVLLQSVTKKTLWVFTRKNSEKSRAEALDDFFGVVIFLCSMPTRETRRDERFPQTVFCWSNLSGEYPWHNNSWRLLRSSLYQMRHWSVFNLIWLTRSNRQGFIFEKNLRVGRQMKRRPSLITVRSSVEK